MKKDHQEYSIFFEFIESYSPAGFKGIDRHDPFIVSLEEVMKNNNQFFCVFDMINMKVEFTSQRSYQMLSIKPEVLTPYHFKEAVHPDDLKRHALGIAKVFKTAHELFVAKKGEMLISSNFRFRNITGNYTNQLIQCYLFFCPVPNNTVYLFNLKTDISWCKKIKNGIHYYIGNDLSYFRYPDNELLMTGIILSNREFEILRLIHVGFNSKQIAEKLFLSTHTIYTHRNNILNKTGKAHISDVIFDLEEQGLL